MFRSPTASKSGASNNCGSTSSIGSRSSANENSPTTIREIRSRTGSAVTANSSSRQLLANRRQAMSMERLNGGSSTVVSSTNNSNDKGSPSSGSSNSINSSPQRGLNRTASRVSRFRSAKAVFERLSNTNGNNSSTTRPAITEKPRCTAVPSRYAAAAAARATAANTNAATSPRSRLPTGSLARSQDPGKSANSNNEIHKHASNTSSSLKFEPAQPRPQPRVVGNKSSTIESGSSSKTTRHSVSSTVTPTKLTAQPKPPPKDLIDKIVLEIARDVPDPDCTIQDLSNCDISGIPETLDFDKCFQDVEMMTEEEARKLLSRKSTPSSSTPAQSADNAVGDVKAETVANLTFDVLPAEKPVSEVEIATVEPVCKLVDVADDEQVEEKAATAAVATAEESSLSSNLTSENSNSSKSKVRFSDEPVKIYNTHAVEDYDRRNDDIDPVAASTEYEIEKSREREGLSIDSDDDDNSIDNGAVKISDRFIQHQLDSSNHGILSGASHSLPHSAPQSDFRDSSGPSQQPQLDREANKDDREYEDDNNTDYIESLEREVNLKRILEQNLRDLQSQYYEAVRELDDYKTSTETKLSSLEQNLNDLTSKLECSQNELTDARELSKQQEKQLDDIKESSQLLEKKYHRAKRMIKDMQSREESFTRREQLYQQKLDEIEFELGVLIESVDRTIYEDGLKFYSTTDSHRQHHACLDAFGLIKQILNNFNVNQSTQNPQIKQRVMSILEQQLANLMVATNGGATGNIGKVPFVAPAQIISSSDNSHQPQEQQQQQQLLRDSNAHSQTNPSYPLASHRLSQPNLPHPIGVGGQPTKLFHGLNPIPVPVSLNEPSPPQSVNSYPSTNSLNSLNNLNNNNHNTANKNNNSMMMAAKLREQSSLSDLQLNSMPAIIPSTTASSINDDKFHPAPDIQVPYQTNEWHDKPVSEWTTTQVSTWLLALGLDQYISKFEDRNVNGQSLINLDSTVLKGLGVLNSNDRNLLKKKIRELRVEMEKERKLIEKKMKENLKDKSKSNKLNGGNRADNNRSDSQQNKSSWKRGLLS